MKLFFYERLSNLAQIHFIVVLIKDSLTSYKSHYYQFFYLSFRQKKRALPQFSEKSLIETRPSDKLCLVYTFTRQVYYAGEALFSKLKTRYLHTGELYFPVYSKRRSVRNMMKYLLFLYHVKMLSDNLCLLLF